MLIRAPIRGNDSQGAGYFGAPRGERTHKGVDISCYKGTEVLSIGDGKVTKIGYPYNPNDTKKGHLRYVQITDGNYDFRYFYVHPTVSIGDINSEEVSVTYAELMQNAAAVSVAYEAAFKNRRTRLNAITTCGDNVACINAVVW